MAAPAGVAAIIGFVEDVADEELYRRYRSGDLPAFEALYARYRQPLFLFFRRGGLDVDEAEDLFQEVWFAVIRAEERFHGGSFRAWLYQVARNRRIDRFRRQRIRAVDELPEDVPDGAPQTERRVDALDCVERLKAGIAALPEAQREVFLLKQEAGLGLQDIADLVRVGRETVKSRLRYAMQRLRQQLEDCL